MLRPRVENQPHCSNIVSLSEIRVDEIMRPRMRFHAFRPPVALSDLEGHVPASGYVLVTEPDTDEVAAAWSPRVVIDPSGRASTRERWRLATERAGHWHPELSAIQF